MTQCNSHNALHLYVLQLTLSRFDKSVSNYASDSEKQLLCRDSAPSWQCEVLFCDDTSRFDALNRLTERYSELAGQRQQLQAKLDAANKVTPHAIAQCTDVTAQSHQLIFLCLIK